MKNVVLTLALALAASSVAAHAQTTATTVATEQARTVQYHSQDIVPIRAKVKYTTLIVVPASEKIMEAATGDKDSGSWMWWAASASSTRPSRTSAPT